jgi:tRNA(Ile)-lysidine synthetase-like protein
MKFLEYLFENPRVWFNSTKDDDNYVVSNFKTEFYNMLSTYPVFQNGSITKQIMFIITMDQLPYYIYRDNYTHENFILAHRKSVSLLIATFFKTNISNIQEFIEHYDSIENLEQYYLLPNQMFWNILMHKDTKLTFYKVFLLLSLRHTKCPFFVNIVFNLSKLLLKQEPDNSVCKRFYKASLLQLELLDNKKQVNLYSKKLSRRFYNNEETDNNKYTNIYNKDILGILDTVNSNNSQWTNDNYELFFQNIKEYNIKKSSLDIITNFKSIVKDISQSLSISNSKELVLSISGGVDSLVLYLLLKSYGFKVHTVFINYNNRYSSKLELEFVKNYLDRLSSDEEYNFYKTITSIKRNGNTKHLRDVYEDSTRKIRFDMYKQILLLPNVNAKYIVLGHNKDDCMENIFTNISKCQKYDNLLGMSFLSEEMGVGIMRPMLGITKSSIYELAREIGMPFLEDSTPKWSMRGRMRDILIPQLNKFDERIIEGLYTLSGYVSNSEKYLDKFIDSLVEYKIEYEEFSKLKTLENRETIQDTKNNLDSYIILCEINKKIKNDTSHDELSMMLKKILGNICMELKLPYVSKKSIGNMSKIIHSCNLDKNKIYTINDKFIFKYDGLDKFIIKYCNV